MDFLWREVLFFPKFAPSETRCLLEDHSNDSSVNLGVVKIVVVRTPVFVVSGIFSHQLIYNLKQGADERIRLFLVFVFL